MKKFLIIILSIFSTSTLNILKEREFDYHIKDKHIFIVTCQKEGPSCDKLKNDFEDNWNNFNFKNSKVFPSKLFEMIKNTLNKDFFSQITNESDKNLIVYVEHENQDFKKYIDPEISSNRKLKAWMSDIESEFADKVIDKKIDELDKIINQQQDNLKVIDQKKENKKIENSKINDSENVKKTDSDQKVVKPEVSETSEVISEDIVVDDKGNEDIMEKIQDFDKDGKLISEKKIHDTTDLFNLEDQINDEEYDKNGKNAKYKNIHDLNLKNLDVKEEKEVESYLLKVLKKKSSLIDKHFKKKDIKKSDGPKLNYFHDIKQKKKEKKEFDIQNVDFGSLSPDRAQVVKDYLDQRLKDTLLAKTIKKKDFNPNILKAIENDKNPTIKKKENLKENLKDTKNDNKITNKENNKNSKKLKDNNKEKKNNYQKNVNLTKKGDRVIVEKSLVGKDVNFSRNTYSFWIYFILIITSLVFILRLFVFYKKKDYMQLSKKYDDVEENSFIAEI